MISPKLHTAASAPATLVSLRRVGLAGLAMADLVERRPAPAERSVSTPAAPSAPRTSARATSRSSATVL